MKRSFPLIVFYLLNVIFCKDFFTVILTVPLFVITVVQVKSLKEKFTTADDMFWLCIYLFFVIHPIQSISNGVLDYEGPVGSRHYENTEISWAMLIVVLYCVSFSFGRGFLARRTPNTGIQSAVAPLQNPTWIFTFLAINILSFVAYAISYGGLANLLSSRNDQSLEEVYIFALLFFGFQNVSAIFLCAMYKHATRSDIWVLSLLAMIVALVLLLMSQNPFNAPRYFLVNTWAPVFLVLIRGRMSAPLFYIICLFLVGIAFPILNLTTRIGISSIADIPYIISADTFFSIPFIDVFDTLIHVVPFMEARSLFYGSKTVAIILFFIPRAFWPGKPIVGGLDVGAELVGIGSAGTDNLSFFIAGDFYMDFWLPGVIIGGLVTGFLFARLSKAKRGFVFGENVLQYVLLAALPILLRGPVGAVLPLFVVQLFSFFVFRKVFKGDKVSTKRDMIPEASW